MSTNFKTRAVLLPTALCLLLSGCGGGGSNGSASSTPLAPTPVAPLSASSTLPDGLTAIFAENAASVASSGIVTYTLTLTNNTSQPVSFMDTLNTDGSATVPGTLSQISNAQGNIVYPIPQTTPAVALPTGPTVTYSLPPGQALTQNVPIAFTFPAGLYTATAFFGIEPTATPPFQSTQVMLKVTVQ